MSKAKSGGKVDQLRSMREAAAAAKGGGKVVAGGDNNTLAAQFAAEVEALKQRLLKPKMEELEAARERLADAQAEVNRIEAEIDEVTGTSTSGRKAKASGGGRVRRGEDQLKADAEAVYAAIKAGGKEGVSGGQLPAKPKAGMSVVDFVKKYAGHAVKMEGTKAQARYHAA